MDETDPSASAPRDPTLTKEEKWRLMQESEDFRNSDGPGVDEIEEQDSPCRRNIRGYYDDCSILVLAIDDGDTHPIPVWETSWVECACGKNGIECPYTGSTHLLQTPTVAAMRYKEHRRLQIGLFLVSIGIGCRMIYLLNRGSLYVNIRQVPPLGTLWIYAIVQLELGPAVLNLAIVVAYVWWKDLKIL